ncbi:MAG: methyltransferase domain-containing protein [candidate division WOR-3 bacterium]
MNKLENLIIKYVKNFFIVKDISGARHKKIAKYAWGKILDLGYAQAPNTFLRGDVTGLDINMPQKKPDNYSRILVGDVEHLSEYFINEQFDTIIAGELIEHLPNYCKFLDECTKLLRVGGTLIISTPNPYLWYTMLANILFPYGKTNEPAHLNYQVPRKLNELLAIRGFSLKKILCGSGLPLMPFTYQLIYIYMKEK